METTIQMVKIAEEDGISDIIATPHYYAGHYENSYEKVCKIVNYKNEQLKEYESNINLFPGQEVYIDRYTLDLYKHNVICGLNGSRYLLIEFDLQRYSKEYLNIVYELRLSKQKPPVSVRTPGV